MLKEIRKYIADRRDRELKWKCIKIAAKAGSDPIAGNLTDAAILIYKWIKGNSES